MAARTGAGGDSRRLGCQAGTPTGNSQSSDGKPSVTAEQGPPSIANGCACATTKVATEHFQHVIIVVLENTDYEAAQKITYLGQLAQQGASFADFHGVTHPSYSNYLAMVAGRNVFTVLDIQRDLNECSIADLLHAKGLAWRNYAEGYPGTVDQCFTEASLGKYARKHVPFMSFIPVQQKQCGNIVNANAFDLDRANGNLPNYAFFSPDLDNDGHDTDVARAAIWLKDFLDPLHSDGAWPKDTLIVVTFDELGNQSSRYDNHIYTVLLGNMIKPNTTIPGRRDHFDVLRTIEDNFGLCTLADREPRRLRSPASGSRFAAPDEAAFLSPSSRLRGGRHPGGVAARAQLSHPDGVRRQLGRVAIGTPARLRVGSHLPPSRGAGAFC